MCYLLLFLENGNETKNWRYNLFKDKNWYYSMTCLLSGLLIWILFCWTENVVLSSDYWCTSRVINIANSAEIKSNFPEVTSFTTYNAQRTPKRKGENHFAKSRFVTKIKYCLQWRGISYNKSSHSTSFRIYILLHEKIYGKWPVHTWNT